MNQYKMSTKRNIVLIVGILLLGVASKNFLQSLKTTPPKKVVEQRKQGVDVIYAQNTVVTPVISSYGVLKAKQRWSITSEVSGRLAFSIDDLEVGNVYKKGDVIASFVAPDIEFQVKKQRSEFITFLAQLIADISVDYPVVSSELKAYMLGLDSGVVIPPLPEILDKQAKLLLTVKQLYSQFFTVKQLESLYDKYHIVAPFDGVIVRVYAELGDTLSMGQAIADFVSIDLFETRTYLNREQALVLLPNEPVAVFTDTESLSGSGYVTFISNAVDESTQTVEVGVDIKKRGLLLDGQFVTLQLQGKPFRNAIELPRQLLQDDNSIYCVEKGQLKKYFPTIVYKTDTTLILKGIPDNTLIVSHLVPGAFEGLHVSTDPL